MTSLATPLLYPWSTRELEAPPSLHSARDSRVSKKTIVELAIVYIHQLKCQLRRDDGEEGDVEVKGKQNRRRLRRGSCSQLLRHLTCRLGRLLRLVTTAFDCYTTTSLLLRAIPYHVSVLVWRRRRRPRPRFRLQPTTTKDKLYSTLRVIASCLCAIMHVFCGRIE